MRQGIYILANDHPRVIPDTIALLNSLKEHSPGYPVLMIPYDSNYQKCFRVLHDMFGVELYDNQPVFAELEERSRAIYGRTSPMIRKLAAWFGPFDQFIYLDSDIVVLQDQADVFDLVDRYDIVYGGSGAQLGIAQVFTERVFARGLLANGGTDDLFNTGFFASKKEVLSYDQLLALLDEAATVSDIFLAGLEDQPLLNYVTLKTFPRRANIRDLAPEPGRPKSKSPDAGRVTCDAWAGDPGLKTEGGRVQFSCGSAVRHIHWGGFKSTAHKPYLDVWLKYRYPSLPLRFVAQNYFRVSRSAWYRFIADTTRGIRNRVRTA